MAETWTAGSTCKLVHVPWDSQYSRVVQFTDAAARDAYFDSLDCAVSLTIGEQTYIRPNTPLTVDAPYSACYGANYLIVENPAQPVAGAKDERLFYFITDTQYASPASTRLILQLDVWQTRFMAGATLHGGYLERGHAPVRMSYDLYKTAGFSLPNVLDRYCTTPEGIDVGANYDVAVKGWESLQASGTGEQDYIVYLTTVDLTSDFGTIDNPNLVTNTGTDTIDGISVGCGMYVLTPLEYNNLIDYLKDYPWISQCCIGVYYIPAALVDHVDVQVTIGGSVTAYNQLHSVDGMWAHGAQLDMGTVSAALDDVLDIADGYLKMAAYPYSYLELTNFSGSPVLLKPERFMADSVLLGFDTMLQLQDFKVAVYPWYYGSPDGEVGQQYDFTFMGKGGSVYIAPGEYLDTALYFGNPPRFMSVNDSASLALANSAYQRQYSYQAAGWQLDRSNAQLRYQADAAQRQYAANEVNQRISMRLTDQQQELSGLNAVAGAGMNLAGGNIGGVGASALSGLVGYLNTQLAQTANQSQFATNQNLLAANADANQRLGAYMAQSNYQQQIASIEATVQSAELTPPSVIGQQGGGLFNAQNGLWAVCLRAHTLPVGARNRVLQYFKRYGYAHHQWINMPERLQIMSHFTYWQVLDLNITCATANETETDAIRGIFAQGVTVFDSVDKLLDFQIPDNVPEVD